MLIYQRVSGVFLISPISINLLLKGYLLREYLSFFGGFLKQIQYSITETILNINTY